MKTLNKYACDILRKYTIHACTDVTGFGLGGHGTEMADGSQKTLVIDTKALPVLPDVEEYASMGLIPRAVRSFGERILCLIRRHPEDFWQQFRQKKRRSFSPN